MLNENLAGVRCFHSFVLDVRSGELYCEGIKIPLQEQPFRILELLTEQPGNLVSREEICKRLWPNGTVVEFENSMNVAMKKLRLALGDSADQPRYIETVKRRGYRLIVGVDGWPSAPDFSSIYPEPASPGTYSRWKRKPSRWLLPAIIAVCLAAVVIWSFLHRPATFSGQGTIVLADFVNRTGDPVFDGTLRQGLAIQLEQSPFLSIVPEDRIRLALEMMAKPADARLTPELATEICERVGAAAVLEGFISNIGTHYVVGLHARNCRTGASIDDEQAEIVRKEEVLDALTKIARKFRSRAGESLASIRKLDTPLAEATTPSLEALKAYTEAQNVNVSAGSAAAAPLFRRAIEIDPQFAIAYASLGVVYADMGELGLSAESTTRGYQLRARTSEHERYSIEVIYDRNVTGNLQRAQQTCDLWTQTYPRDVTAHDLCAGFVLQGAGYFEKSIQEARRGMQLDPDNAYAYVNLAASYLYTNRLQEAESTIEQAFNRKLRVPELFSIAYNSAFLRRDAAEMKRRVTQAEGISGAEDWMAHLQALVFARSGRLELAESMSRRGVDVAQQVGQLERAATYEAAVALWQTLFGNTEIARRHAIAAQQLSTGRDVQYASALALALSGDSAQATAAADSFAKLFPEDTSVRFSYVPVLRAVVALNNGFPSAAIEELRAAEPHELSISGITFFGFFGGLYSAYLRGEAYLALHEEKKAAQEFHKIMDHPGIVMADPVGALAHLQLARAFAASGNTEMAKDSYHDFLTIWRDADPDVPVLKQAKSEYAKLRN
jgi:DNA-binding winged helix-turn-helix (wHTH) protein/tetratricopeptide (TPR) repeat protein